MRVATTLIVREMDKKPRRENERSPFITESIIGQASVIRLAINPEMDCPVPI